LARKEKQMNDRRCYECIYWELIDDYDSKSSRYHNQRHVCNAISHDPDKTRHQFKRFCTIAYMDGKKMIKKKYLSPKDLKEIQIQSHQDLN
jgi:hypothetical protein